MSWKCLCELWCEFCFIIEARGTRSSLFLCVCFCVFIMALFLSSFSFCFQCVSELSVITGIVGPLSEWEFDKRSDWEEGGASKFKHKSFAFALLLFYRQVLVDHHTDCNPVVMRIQMSSLFNTETARSETWDLIKLTACFNILLRSDAGLWWGRRLVKESNNRAVVDQWSLFSRARPPEFSVV